MSSEYTPFIVIAVAWALIYLVSRLLPLKKYGIDVSPLYIMLKTQRLNSFLENTANKNPRVWRMIGNIGIIVAVGEMAFAGYILTSNLLNFFYAPQRAQPVFPIVPGVTISSRSLPYLLIAIGLAITVHELAHGIIASLDKISVKSAGILIAPITFGGFVEPDEEKLDNAKLTAKLRLFAVGSLSNLAFGLLATILLMSLFLPASGVIISNVRIGSPAYYVGVQAGDVIQSLNGVQIDSLYKMISYMANIKPGDSVRMGTLRGSFDIVTEASTTNSSQGVMGVEGLTDYHPMKLAESIPQVSYNLYVALNWLSMMMINLAVFNMFPLFPLDGESYVYSIVKTKLKRGYKEARTAINLFALSLMALNMGLTFMRYGLVQI